MGLDVVVRETDWGTFVKKSRESFLPYRVHPQHANCVHLTPLGTNQGGKNSRVLPLLEEFNACLSVFSPTEVHISAIWVHSIYPHMVCEELRLVVGYLLS